MSTFLFFRYGNRMLILFFLFGKRVQILKTEYKYGQYCIPLSQSDWRYFFVLTIIRDILISELPVTSYELISLQVAFIE